ncbi:hypothetical protein ACHQM5_029995 [Ranunculus cassubicifolius]
MVKKVRRVCVTGGGGYLASWLVKLLLSKGYIVQATVREPDDERNAHLKTFEKSSENLLLFKADLLNYDSLFTAIKGCCGVFHVATSIEADNVPNPKIEIIEPAVTGTSNVLKACSEANINRVVVVSSMAAVVHNLTWPKGQPMDESCWTDIKTCMKAEPGYHWYSIGKTTAESWAIEYGKRTGLDVITVCPSIIVGPMLQSKINTSSLFFYSILEGSLETMENKIRTLVDVRDIAEALLLVFEKPEAKGRYICSSHTITIKKLIKKMKRMYPAFNLPNRVSELNEDWDLTSEKLQKLGWKYRSLEETIMDSVKVYQERGILKKVKSMRIIAEDVHRQEFVVDAQEYIGRHSNMN